MKRLLKLLIVLCLFLHATNTCAIFVAWVYRNVNRLYTKKQREKTYRFSCIYTAENSSPSHFSTCSSLSETAHHITNLSFVLYTHKVYAHSSYNVVYNTDLPIKIQQLYQAICSSLYTVTLYYIYDQWVSVWFCWYTWTEIQSVEYEAKPEIDVISTLFL